MAIASKLERVGPTRRQSPEYRTWANMIQRCGNPRTPSYKNYGARGITVCDRWRSSFAAFYDDVGDRPSLEHSIDRGDVNGPYACGRCDECRARGWTTNGRWASLAEQGIHRRDNRRVEFRGESLCVTEWASRLGIGVRALKYRLDSGWPVERAFTERVGRYRRRRPAGE